MIAGLAHVNLIIPDGSLEQATEFYGNTLGLTPRKVPEGQRHRVAWFDIGSSGQQVHIAYVSLLAKPVPGLAGHGCVYL